MEGFAKYAQYLEHPLTLIGFVLLLFFSVHKMLISSGIIPPLSARSGSRILQSLLRYGFIIALLVVALGFGLKIVEAMRVKSANEELTEKLRRGGFMPNMQAKHIDDVVKLSQSEEQDRQALKTLTRDAENLIAKVGIDVTAENLTGLGFLYLEQGEAKEAKASFLRATEKNPSLGPAYAGLAIATQLEGNEYLTQQNYDQAQKTLEEAERYAKVSLQYYPDDGSSAIQLGFTEKDLAQYYLSQGYQARANESLAAAERLFKMGLGANPENEGAHNGLGDVHLLKGEYDDAIKEFKVAVKIQPAYTYAWHDLALAYYQRDHNGGQPDRESVKDSLSAVMKVYELQLTPNAMHLPAAALRAFAQIKDFAVEEAAKVKTNK
jgi:tetratricopeptide (TPR) repeat protein